MIIFDLHGRQIFDLLEDLLETTGWISMKSDVDFHDLRELITGSSWPPNHSSCKKKKKSFELKEISKAESRDCEALTFSSPSITLEALFFTRSRTELACLRVQRRLYTGLKHFACPRGPQHACQTDWKLAGDSLYVH